jgi:indole-3-glycerol phosphate synthase
MATILDEIVEVKKAEVAERKLATPMADIERAAQAEAPARDFVDALTAPLDGLRAAIISEIKRKSPSAGWIRPEYEPSDSNDVFAPEDIARRYHQAGARAISCLTDERFFGGRLDYLQRVRSAVPLPVIRKDFMVDIWQVFESRAAGADAVLLIAECLSDDQIIEMIEASVTLGMGVLLESHDEVNLDRSIRLAGQTHPKQVLVGINNRDLRIMKVDLGHTTRLAGKVPDASMLVSESGIKVSSDLDRLAESGVHIALVGEHLMAQPNPGEALSKLLG